MLRYSGLEVPPGRHYFALKALPMEASDSCKIQVFDEYVMFHLKTQP